MSEETGTERSFTPLPIKKILIEAFLVPWEKRLRMAQALFLPILGMTALRTFRFSLDDQFWFASIFPSLLGHILLFTLFAVTCHRLILMGDNSITKYGLKTWSRRETRFLGWCVKMWFLCVLIIMIPVASFDMIRIHFHSNTSDPFSLWLIYILAIPGLYVSGRLSLVLPAIAVDERPNFAWAWKLSKGNGWRLFIAVVILPLLLSLMGGGFICHAKSLTLVALINLLSYTLLTVEITALSLSYKSLTGKDVRLPQ